MYKINCLTNRDKKGRFIIYLKYKHLRSLIFSSFYVKVPRMLFQEGTGTDNVTFEALF